MAVGIIAAVDRRSDRRFYVGMSVLIAAIVFAGFSRTFYMAGYFHGPALSPLRIVHGTLFSAWILLFIVQTTLIAAGRRDVHRRLGVGGAILAAGMVAAGTGLAISAARDGRAPPGLDPRGFLAIPLFDMIVFATLVAAGVYYRRKSEVHKRLMLLATISILGAAVARLPSTPGTGGPLLFFGIVDLLVLAGPTYDFVSSRKVNPAYVWGGMLILGSQLFRLVFSRSAAWLAIADVLTGR